MVMIDSPRPQAKVSATRILVVEDEQIIAINLRELLESLGYVVPALAATAKQAIDLAAALRPDLVLMDIRLKGKMDGIEAADVVWNMLQIPVIYVTGHSDQSTLDRVKVTAPFGYILKPVKDKELYVAIESALQRAARELLLLTVFKSMGDGVIVTDTHGDVKFLNPMAEVLTGWTQADARDRPLAEVFFIMDGATQQPIVSNLIETALAQDGPLYLENQILLSTRQGTLLPIADSFTSIRDNRGTMTGIVIVFRDITQRLLAEERDRAVERAQQLEAQVAEMERLSQLKEDFLATVSHELRTPLSNIQLATRMLTIVLDQFGLLAQESEPGSKALSQYIRILKDQSEQELVLVNDLLDMQRINAESYPLDLSVVQPCEWLRHVLEPFETRTQDNQQHLYINIPEDLPTLQTDTHILTRIVFELLNNACKYTPPQGTITLSSRLIDDYDMALVRVPHLMIEVCNTGVEIPEEECERIFEPFYRIPKSDRWAKGGTGLGLALVKKFARHLGGSVKVACVADQLCFSVYLPLCPLSDTP